MNLPTYTSRDPVKFVDDMDEAGREVEHYHGRAMWNGPAVRVERHELQDVIRETTVRLQWDTLGEGYIVYPVQSDPGSEAQ